MRDWFSSENALIVDPASGTGASSTPCRIDPPGCPTGRVTFSAWSHPVRRPMSADPRPVARASRADAIQWAFPSPYLLLRINSNKALRDEVRDFRDLALGGRIGEIRRGGVRWLYFLGTAASWRETAPKCSRRIYPHHDVRPPNMGSRSCRRRTRRACARPCRRGRYQIAGQGVLFATGVRLDRILYRWRILAMAAARRTQRWPIPTSPRAARWSVA